MTIDPAAVFPGTVVVMAPHMDDEVLACGGTMALLSRRGDVHVVYATDGVAAPAPPRGHPAPPQLREIRRREAREASAELGIGDDNVHFLDLPDGRLRGRRAELRRFAAEIVAKIRPAHLFVPFRFDRHPDHLALNRVATDLVDDGAADCALVEYFTYYRWQLLPGRDLRRYVRRDQRVAVDIDAARAQKRRALERFETQTTRYYPWQTRPVLTPDYLDHACSGPELFVLYDPSFAGSAVLDRRRIWVRMVHRSEPTLKALKDRLASRWRRARRPGDPAPRQQAAGGARGAPPHRRRHDRDTERPPVDRARAPDGRIGPIRVVVFGRGPLLERGVEEFLRRLEARPEVELAAGFFEARGSGWPGAVRDIWRRRGALALVLVPLELGRRLASLLADPGAALERRRASRSLADRLHFVPDIHAPEVLDRVRALEPELGLIYGAPILRPELFELPEQGTLGIHHGKLPEYRGVKTTFWSMFHGEETAGVAIQRVDAGLDTGELVKTGEVPIGNRSRRRVWRDVEELGLRLYLEAILEVREGTATFRPQAGPRGRLYREPGPRDLLRFALRRLRRRLRGWRRPGGPA